MSEVLNQTARRLRRKLTLAVWLGRGARQGALVLAICACAALIGRVSFELELREAALCFLPLVAVPFWAWRGARERIPSEAGAAAWLDLHSGAAGYLLADYELDDPRWRERAAQQLDALPELPALRVASITRPLLPALAFTVLALLVPLTRAEPGPSTSLFDRAVAALAEKLDTLNEVVDLDEVVADELAERVAQLSEDIDASEPEAMLEAIDSLREKLGVEGQDAADLAQQLSERFGEIGARALSDPETAQSMMEAALSKMMEGGFKSDLLQQLNELAPELAQSLEGNQLQLPEGFKLSPEQMKSLSTSLRNAMKNNMGALSLAGLVNLSELKLSKDGSSLSKLIERFHECDEDCEKPGGT
jgi:hypothetical protein